jgi:DNA-binding IclR family transcriptional regulator
MRRLAKRTDSLYVNLSELRVGFALVGSVTALERVRALGAWLGRESMEVEGRGVGSIVVGGRLLEVMAAAGRPLMLRDIAAGAKITPAQAHAYLVSYRKLDLVEQVNSSGLYQLGPFALQLGLARMRSVDALRLANAAVVDLAAELGLMLTVAVWGTFGPTIVQVQEAVDQVHVNLRAGAVYAVRSTATGRVFAAFLPQAIIKAHLDAERQDGSERHRIGNPEAASGFEKEVEQVKRLGYATANGSPIPSINAISAPVFDHTGQMQLAATLIGPAKVVDIRRGSPQVKRLLAFTEDLSSKLGYQGPSEQPETEGTVIPLPKPVKVRSSPAAEKRRRA